MARMGNFCGLHRYGTALTKQCCQCNYLLCSAKSESSRSLQATV